MSTFKVTEVGENIRDWDSKHGPMKSYYVKFEGDERTIEIAQKPSTPAPTVGQTFEGTIEERQWQDKTFYKLKKAQGGFGGGGGFRPEDPERSRRILRQHSQHMALLWMQNTMPHPNSEAGVSFRRGLQSPDWLKPIIDWFDADVETAGGPSPAAGANPPGNGRTPPSEARGNGSPYPSVKQLNRAEAIAKSHNITKGEWEQLERVMGFTVAESPDRDSYDRWCDYLERKLPIPNSGSDVAADTEGLSHDTALAVAGEGDDPF